MRFLSVAVVASSMAASCFAASGYGHLQFGQASIQHEGYRQPSTGITGFGIRFQDLSIELSYLAFSEFKTTAQPHSYIKLFGTRFAAKYRTRFGDAHPYLGVSSNYYRGSAYHDDLVLARVHDESYGGLAGIEFQLNPDLLFLLQADYVEEVLGQELLQWTLGLRKEW